MNDVLTNVIDRGVAPTRQDIADVLASIGAPSEKRDEKRAAVLEVFAALGGGTNSQGHHVVDTLDSYGEY